MDGKYSVFHYTLIYEYFDCTATNAFTSTNWLEYSQLEKYQLNTIEIKPNIISPNKIINERQ